MGRDGPSACGLVQLALFAQPKRLRRMLEGRATPYPLQAGEKENIGGMVVPFHTENFGLKLM